MRKHQSSTALGCLVPAGLPILLVLTLYGAHDPIGATGLILALLVYVGLPVLAVWAVHHAILVHRRQSTAHPDPMPAGPPAHQPAPASPASLQPTKHVEKPVYWDGKRVGWADEAGNVHFDSTLPA
jgi:hypothetical protein